MKHGTRITRAMMAVLIMLTAVSAVGSEELLDIELIRQLIFEKINQERIKYWGSSRYSLVMRPELNIIAQRHSDRMVEYRFKDHTDPINGSTTEDRIVGYLESHGFYDHSFGLAQGEIIARIGLYPHDACPDEETVAQKAVDRWMDSWGHMEAITQHDFEYTGIGIGYMSTRPQTIETEHGTFNYTERKYLYVITQVFTSSY